MTEQRSPVGTAPSCASCAHYHETGALGVGIGRCALDGRGTTEIDSCAQHRAAAPDAPSFAAHPPTIGELRSDRTGEASDWSARDALICVLRELDAGRIKPDTLLIGWSERLPSGKRETTWRAVSPDPLLTAGLAQRLAAHVVAAA